ncbi:MAG: streptomycin 6-kinase [Gaiellales bacterium]|nr:streptomycin 6-kinase [Gaiellales bacterium]
MSDASIHAGLAWLESSEEGREWLKRLPGLVEGTAARWSLTVGPPFEYAFASLALPVRRADGTDAVLKLQFPGREGEHEAAALEHWGGDGAVRLLDHDPERHALLIERCTPGTPLSAVEADAALDVVIGLLPRLWTPAASPFRTLADEATWWVEEMQADWERLGEPFERDLFDAALEALGELPATQGEQVLLHQDLHAGNILEAEREPWLVIDPKPLIGEREFGVVPIVRGMELGHSREAVLRRLRRVTAALDLDEDRARRWTIAQTIAWCFDTEGATAEHVEIARWLL